MNAGKSKIKSGINCSNQPSKAINPEIKKAVSHCWYCGGTLPKTSKNQFCSTAHEKLWDKVTNKALKDCDKIKNCEVCGKKFKNEIGESHCFNLSISKNRQRDAPPKVESHRYCSESCFQKGFVGKKGIGMVASKKR